MRLWAWKSYLRVLLYLAEGNLFSSSHHPCWLFKSYYKPHDWCLLLLYRYIAVEFASIWRGMGAAVNLCFRKELPLRLITDDVLWPLFLFCLVFCCKFQIIHKFSSFFRCYGTCKLSFAITWCKLVFVINLQCKMLTVRLVTE